MLLKIGSTGDEVKQLQARLGVSNTGTFGSVTDGKVKEWQIRNNLTANGVVDELAWSMLFPVAGLNGGIVPPTGFKLDNLRGKIPEPVISQLPETAAKFNINNVFRMAHLLSQCGHESGDFRILEENLNYSAERLKEIFPGLFEGAIAEAYARNPVKIASRAYAHKIGNGDEAGGDGYKYRGRGFIQLTGRENYRSFARYIGEDTENNPDLVATKYPLASAAFYFSSRNLWSICDGGNSIEVITLVTRKVNAKLLGLQERINHFNLYFNLLK